MKTPKKTITSLVMMVFFSFWLIISSVEIIAGYHVLNDKDVAVSFRYVVFLTSDLAFILILSALIYLTSKFLKMFGDKFYYVSIVVISLIMVVGTPFVRHFMEVNYTYYFLIADYLTKP